MKIKNINSLIDSLTDCYRQSTQHKVSDPETFSNEIRKELLVSYPASESPRLIDATVLIGDIRGFTRMSDQYPPETIFSLLNNYFSRLIGIIQKYDGLVDKFVGDAVMVLFPAETSEEVLTALSCAIDMQREIVRINKENRNNSLETLHMGIGISTGKVVAGCIGSSDYQEYTVLGSEVNLASRVESYSMRGQILISENTYARCHQHLTTGTAYDLHPKGQNHQVKVFELHSIDTPEEKTVPRVTRRRFVRAKADFNTVCSLVKGKHVVDESFIAKALDVSYSGIGLETLKKIKPMSEILIRLPISFITSADNEVYGRVVHTVKTEAGYKSGVEFTAIDDSVLNGIKQYIDLSIQQYENI